jgi:protein SCO1
MKRVQFIQLAVTTVMAALAALSGAVPAWQVGLANAQSAAGAVPADLPGNSVYQLKIPLVDQDGHKTRWDDAPKGPRIVSMFYSNCDFVCPMLFEAIKIVEAGLPVESRQRLSVGLVSLDPQRDTPAVLKKSASQRSVDETRWRLYRADATDVRKLAATLGIQYRQLTGGEFNHSTVLILLDAQGRVMARTEKISAVDPVFMKAVQALTAAPGA